MKWLVDFLKKICGRKPAAEITVTEGRIPLRVGDNSGQEALTQAVASVAEAADLGNASPQQHVAYDEQGNSTLTHTSLLPAQADEADVVVTGGPPVREVGSGRPTDPDHCVSSRHLYARRQLRDVQARPMDRAELERRISEHKSYVADVTAQAKKVEDEARAIGERVAGEMLKKDAALACLIGDVAVAEASKDHPEPLSREEEGKLREEALLRFVKVMGDQAVNELRVRSAQKLYGLAGKKPYEPFRFGHQKPDRQKL